MRLALWLTLLFAGSSLAQSTAAEVFGVVRDSAGLAIPGAVVRAEPVPIETTTGSDGSYYFAALPAGPCRITVSKPGFRTLQRDGIYLPAGERLALNFELLVGDLSELMEVTAEAPLLSAERGTVRFAVEQRKIASLPLDGRNFIPLIALSPGVNLPPGSTLPRINGSRPRVSEYIYDGVSVLQPEPGQVAFFPIIDAIDEFRVEANSYSAEYGRSNGGIILVNQKSGSNEMHGSLFEYFRNEILNARNLFAPRGPKPSFRRNQYGFAGGGPVQRNRTFFFADWQGTRLATGVIRTSTVPAAEQRQGIFSQPIFDPLSTRRTEFAYLRDRFPNDAIPRTRFDRTAAGVVDRYSTPNVAGGANNYVRGGTERIAQDQFDARLDRYFRSRHRLFGRYTYLRDSARPTTPLPDGSGNISSGIIAETLTRADGIAAEHSWTLSPSQINQLRLGHTQRRFNRESLELPIYEVIGFQQLGPPPNSDGYFATSVTQLLDTYAWVAAQHSLKVGADLRRQRLDVFQPPGPRGSFQFTSIATSGLTPGGAVVPGTGNSFASFLLGQVQNFQIDVQEEVLRPRATIAEFFVQDDWRATPRLSVNLGVRYTLNFPSTVDGDRGAVFNLDSQKLDFLGRDGFPRSARNIERLNLAPRAGLAFRISDSSVARAGYGLTWIEQAGITTPFTTPLFPFIRTLGRRSLDNISPAFVLEDGPQIRIDPPDAGSGLGQGVFGVQRNQHSGYAQQWNFSLQKTFGQHWSIEAGYLGSKLTNLGVPDVNLNQLPPPLLQYGPLLTEMEPNPFFGQVPVYSSIGGPAVARHQLLRPFPRFTTVSLYRNNVGHSTYHSFQSRVEKRLSQGLTLTAAFTWSKLIDDAGAVFDSAILAGPPASFQAADSFNRRLEKDVSTGNIPRIFSAGFVYELPWLAGWQLAGIARMQSGSPIAVTQATNLNAFAGFGIQRPNRVDDPALPSGERTTARWFNAAAFTQARQFVIGNSSRNPVTGPGYSAIDLMIGKTFVLTDRLRSELRIEGFNITNTPPLGNPNGSFGTPAFGSITTALDPRVFELVLKLHF
jgi:hypothetical protein